MAALLARLVEDSPHAPVIYLSNGPWNLAGTITDFLDRHGFPAGALLLTDWGISPRAWFRSGKAHKRGSLERLAEELPSVDWVLIGDDGEHDPEIYRDFARAHPQQVAAIALRSVAPMGTATPETEERVGSIPVFRAGDGTALADKLVRSGLLVRGSTRPHRGGRTQLRRVEGTGFRTVVERSAAPAGCPDALSSRRHVVGQRDRGAGPRRLARF